MSMNLPPNQDDAPMLEINTTPLIDVMLVLLVMLIITVAAPTFAVRMNLPVAAKNPMPSAPTEAINLELTAKGQIIWNGARLADSEALQTRMHDAAQQQPQAEIHLRPDPAVPYQDVVRVLSTAQRLGVKKLAVVGNDRFAH